ncbi:MAG: acetyl-CoA carboxylase biotin carboxyl carrier protein [Thermodesulfobacteriota bacterium]
MDLKEIKALYKFFKGTDLVELETENEGGKVRFARSGIHGEVKVDLPVAQAPVASPAVTPVERVSEESSTENIEIITSPMVGTFYRAPSPEAPPFIQDGDLVKKGQPVCIIEAMKLMNDVESEFKGKVIDIMVENGQPVEYGEPLVKIEVAG